MICDRFANSTRVYQGVLGHVDQRLIKGLERVSIGDLAPDLTVILDMPVEEGLERVKLRRGEAKPDRFEAENVEFHQKLRQAYLAIAAEEPARCVVIDAGAAKEAVAKRGLGRGEVAARAALRGLPTDSWSSGCAHGASGQAKTTTATRRRIRGRLRSCSAMPRPNGHTVRLSLRPGAARFSDCRARAASARRRWPTAWRASCWPTPIRLAPEVAAATSLAVDAKHPVARRIAAQAQPDLLVIERTLNDKGVLHNQIAVEDIRKTVAFFGSTAGEGGWRIAIVDAVDELNRSGANALLKVLEEPPRRALLLLVSHSAARVPATLRSRCRILNLRPLAEADVAAAVAAATGAAGDAEIAAAAAAADGSVARAFSLLDEGALALRQQALDLLDRLPALDGSALHALGEALAGTDAAPLAAFVDTINAWLARRFAREGNALPRLARLADAWQRINRAARDAEIYNFERKPLVFSVFGLLAEATRG